MVAGYENQGHVQRVHQVAEVVEWQIPAGEDQLGRAYRAQVRAERVVHLVGYCEHVHHMLMVRAEGWPEAARTADCAQAIACAISAKLPLVRPGRAAATPLPPGRSRSAGSARPARGGMRRPCRSEG